jgi:uncharacterized protein (TIGR03067 family)
MRLLALAVSAVLSASLSVAADDKELEKFQGDWRVVSVTKDGKAITGEALKGKVWRFEGNKLPPLDNKTDAATITVDPAQKPGTLDLKDKSGDVVQGIDKFTGADKLTICGRGGGKRPKEFDASKGSAAILFELERAKKK